MLFRMGISDYISRTHHGEQYGKVFTAYLPELSTTASETDHSNGDIAQAAEVSTISHSSRSTVSQPVCNRARRRANPDAIRSGPLREALRGRDGRS